MKILVVIGFVVERFSATRMGKLPSSSSGSWVSGLIENLQSLEGIELALAMQAPIDKFFKEDKGGVACYYLPNKRFSRFDVNVKDCVSVIRDCRPDVVHAEGAESYIANRFFKSFHGKKVVSIKGVFNDVQRYEFGGLSFLDLAPRFLIYYFFLLWHMNIRFLKRRRLERETYMLADAALGRTLYDRSHVYAFKKELQYYHIGEDLRDEFHESRWASDDIEKYSVFMNNGRIARKGAHILVRAFCILKREFPTCKLYLVVGKRRFLDKFLYKGYLAFLIKKNGISENVIFLDSLNAEGVACQLRRVNVYVVSSFVENSSNSLGEAMVMGTPCVVSYCGGVSSIAKDEEEALFYRPDDYKMLAYQIRRVFSEDVDVEAITARASVKANKLYSVDANRVALKNFYVGLLK